MPRHCGDIELDTETETETLTNLVASEGVYNSILGKKFRICLRVPHLQLAIFYILSQTKSTTKMADPGEASPQAANPVDMENDRDLDAEMEDTQEDVTAHVQDPSSSTLDHEATQTESQPTSSLPHQNRKDTTLREFLSKMDDYAPIVRTLRSVPSDRPLFSILHVPPSIFDIISCPLLDPRCRNGTLPNPLRPPTSFSARSNWCNNQHDTSATCPPPRPRNPEIYRRHCCRRIPILANTIVKFSSSKQPSRWCRRGNTCTACSRRDGWWIERW